MIFMTYPSVHIKQSILYSVVVLYEYSHHRNSNKISEDHLKSTFICLQCSFYCMEVCWNGKTVLAFLFSPWLNHCESSRRETKRERPAICAFIMWLFGATVQTTDGLRGPISLHPLFHWVEMIPSVSSPLRAPSHHRSSFSPCMCALSIKRSISFRRPQGATSTLAQIGIAQSGPLQPLPFLHTRPPMWLSDGPPSCTQWPTVKSRRLVACNMTCDIRLTQWHKRRPGSVVHPTMPLVCCLFSSVLMSQCYCSVL